MVRIALPLIAVLMLAAPAFAQAANGNWACRNADTATAGILTIYGGVYGFASTTFGDPASGTGTLTPYEDGVGFNDGQLRASSGIEAGRIVSDPTAGTVIQLETGTAIVMVCRPR